MHVYLSLTYVLGYLTGYLLNVTAVIILDESNDYFLFPCGLLWIIGGFPWR